VLSRATEGVIRASRTAHDRNAQSLPVTLPPVVAFLTPENYKPSLKHCAGFRLTRKPQRPTLARIPYFRHVYYRVANLRDAVSLFTTQNRRNKPAQKQKKPARKRAFLETLIRRVDDVAIPTWRERTRARYVRENMGPVCWTSAEPIAELALTVGAPVEQELVAIRSEDARDGCQLGHATPR
jgi:hypothetical protein